MNDWAGQSYEVAILASPQLIHFMFVDIQVEVSRSKVHLEHLYLILQFLIP